MSPEDELQAKEGQEGGLEKRKVGDQTLGQLADDLLEAQRLLAEQMEEALADFLNDMNEMRQEQEAILQQSHQEFTSDMEEAVEGLSDRLDVTFCGLDEGLRETLDMLRRELQAREGENDDQTTVLEKTRDSLFEVREDVGQGLQEATRDTSDDLQRSHARLTEGLNEFWAQLAHELGRSLEALNYEISQANEDLVDRLYGAYIKLEEGEEGQNGQG